MQIAETSSASFLRDPKVQPASVQMAIDAYLLKKVAQFGNPVFRVYRMNPPAVTIGRHQQWRRVVDEVQCQTFGWEWTRRPTGGGALLHAHEINYAIVAPRGVLAPQGRGEFRTVFAVIGQALSKALTTMGFDPRLRFGERGGHHPQHGLCGRSITGNEIAVDGRKIIAAAQLITPDGVLQHGTVYINAPQGTDRFWPITESENAADELVQRWSALGAYRPSSCWGQIAAEFESAIRSSLPVECAHFRLNDAEFTEVEMLCREWERIGWQKSR